MMLFARGKHKTSRRFDPDDGFNFPSGERDYERKKERKKESATKRGKNERACKKIPRKDGLMSSTVSSFRFFASAVVISLLSLRDLSLF